MRILAVVPAIYVHLPWVPAGMAEQLSCSSAAKKEDVSAITGHSVYIFSGGKKQEHMHSWVRLHVETPRGHCPFIVS